MNDILEALYFTRETLVILPLAAFCFIPVYQDIKSPLPKLAVKLAVSFVSVEALMFFVYLLFSMEIASILNTILCITIFFWLYQNEIDLPGLHSWFIFCTACLIGSFSFLFYHIVDIFLRPNGNIYTANNSSSFLLQIGFEIISIVLILHPSRKHLSWLIHNFYEERIWRIVWILPISFMIFALYFIPYDNEVMYHGRLLKMYSIVIIVLLALIIFIYGMFYAVAHSIVEKQEMLKKTAYLELQQEQYRQLQAHVQETSRLRHDFRHQIIVIDNMLDEQKYQELKDYLGQYISHVDAIPVQYCSSAAVNAILNHYNTICREETISLQIDVHLLDLLSDIEMDFCVLLGNLLENAVEGCRTLPSGKRNIFLKMGQTSAHMIALVITNPYAGSIRKQNGAYLSSKHAGNGQGLRSVQSTAEHYNGFMTVNHDNNIFEVKVLLNI